MRKVDNEINRLVEEMTKFNNMIEEMPDTAYFLDNNYSKKELINKILVLTSIIFDLNTGDQNEIH